MPMFSKRHYDATAKAIQARYKALMDKISDSDGYEVWVKRRNEAFLILENLIQTTSDMFRADNPAFSPEKFRVACGAPQK